MLSVKCFVRIPFLSVFVNSFLPVFFGLFCEIKVLCAEAYRRTKCRFGLLQDLYPQLAYNGQRLALFRNGCLCADEGKHKKRRSRQAL